MNEGVGLMKSKELVEILKERLPNEHFQWQYDKETDKLRLDHTVLKKGMEISISDIIVKYNQKKEAAIDEVVYTIDATFRAMEKEKMIGFKGQTAIYPVIRSTSFAEQTSAGHRFLMKDHTAETRVR